MSAASAAGRNFFGNFPNLERFSIGGGGTCESRHRKGQAASEEIATSTSSNSHLSDEQILLLLSAEIPASDRTSVALHLNDCAACRERLESRQSFMDETSAAVSLLDDHSFATRLQSYEAPRRPFLARRPLRDALVSVAAACMVAAIIFSQSESHPVSAQELLDRAVLSQDGSSPVHAVRMRSGSVTCIATAPEPACDTIRNSLAASSWDTSHPLSARAFRTWRGNLHHKQDSVRATQSTLTLTTSTTEGMLHQASLSLRPSDFEPISLTMRFGSGAEIEISEEPAPAPSVNLAGSPRVEPTARADAALGAPDPTPATPPLTPPNPLDAAEVEAWLALDRVKAVSGYEALVVRTSSGLEVKAVVNDETRRQELASALAAIPGIRLSLHIYADAKPADFDWFPKRDPGGVSPPLAEDWLKRQFADTDSANAFKSLALATAKDLHGRAFVLRILENAALRLPASLGAQLEPMIAVQRANLQARLSELAAMLEPLMGSVDPALAVSPEAAESIDSALTSLIFGSSPTAGSLASQIERLRAGLSR
jgi:hypothetical protein